MKLVAHTCVVQRLSINGVTLSLPPVSSWCAQGHLYQYMLSLAWDYLIYLDVAGRVIQSVWMIYVHKEKFVSQNLYWHSFCTITEENTQKFILDHYLRRFQCWHLCCHNKYTDNIQLLPMCFKACCVLPEPQSPLYGLLTAEGSCFWPGTYDMIYLLTAIGLTPGGSSTVHIYTQTIHRTTQFTN
jgi:hypothetical protein